MEKKECEVKKFFPGDERVHKNGDNIIWLN